MFDQQLLKNKTAIITGGSRGIGRAIVECFVKAGAKVYFFYHQNQNAALELVHALEKKKLKVCAMPLDVRDEAACQRTFATICEKNKQLDILVNNSGILQHQALLTLSDTEIQEIIKINITGVLNVTKSFIHGISDAARIINLSSVAGRMPSSGQSSYGATKGAIDSITRALAIELAPKNVHVNAIAPGVIVTDMTRDLRNYGETEIMSKLLIKRYGNTEEVANLALFLSSPYADYITGQTFYLDGGFKR